MKDLLIGLALISCPAVIFAVFGIPGMDVFDERDSEASIYSEAAEGRIAFAEACAGCHGRAAEGTRRGPALADWIHYPERFDDDAFRRAVREGGFPDQRSGVMPAFPNLSERDLDWLLAFVREVQRENRTR